ncbi:ABC transporter substrate-binding protein [Bradyrhizobium sp. UFLA 03-164]|uniref:ABC transporter substrate-binding protein n=1 Tax=Bradyrhizobium uaiense TaxID=2594946 RepID=A0A6P1BDE0_9BRAD|nr:ABC transporter substrate-binding protein [Bradyrhizobium uaiense]
MISRRKVLKGGGALAAFAGIGLPGIARASDTVKIGLTIPTTGLQAILGQTLLNCYQLAAEQLNAKNGIGGRKIELVVEDNQTTTKGAVDKARKLLGQDKVDVIMGGIISLERAGTLSVTAKAKKLYFYPTFFEGGECSRYFVATGAIPTQQVDPVVPWVTSNLGKSVYILGSDYSWPRKMTDAITAALGKAGGRVVAADFYPFGTQDFGPAFQRVKDLKPDVVWSMVVGNDGVGQLKQYRSFDLKQPMVGPADEVINMAALPKGLAAGTYAPQSYWMAIDTPANKAFIKNFRSRFGEERMLNSIGEAAYNGLNLYALAVEKAGSVEDDKVIAALSTVEFDAPQGPIRIDPSNNCCVLNSYVGKCAEDGWHYEVTKSFGQIAPVTPDCNLRS